MLPCRGPKKQLCGHCGKVLGVKTYNEHKRLFYCDGEWLNIDRSRSRSSSPINFSSDSSPKSPDYPSHHCNSSDTELEDGDFELEVDETTQGEWCCSKCTLNLIFIAFF